MADGWRPIRLEFPILGQDERYAYQKQPPYSTPRALNVRPFDVLERRAGRGGVRPGLARARGERLGTTGPVRMLNQLGYQDARGFEQLADWFHTAEVSPIWDQTQAWIAAPSIWPIMSSLKATSGLVQWGLLSGEDFFSAGHTTNAYMIDLFILPWLGKHWDSIFTIWARLNTAVPNPNTDCIKLALTLNYAGTVTGSVTLVKNGADIATQALTTTGCNATTPGMLRLKLGPANIANAWYQGVHLLTDYDISGLGANAQHRFAFGLRPTKVHADSSALVDAVRCTRFNGLPQQRRNGLIASAEGKLYVEDEAGRLAQYSPEFGEVVKTLADEGPILSAERDAILFIADWEPLTIADDDLAITLGDYSSATAQWVRSEAWGAGGIGWLVQPRDYGLELVKVTAPNVGGFYTIYNASSMPTDKVSGVFLTPKTTITGTFGRFFADMVGASLVIDTVGTFTISDYVSPTVIKVTGNATCTNKAASTLGYTNPHAWVLLVQPALLTLAETGATFRVYRSPKAFVSDAVGSRLCDFISVAAERAWTYPSVSQWPLGYKLLALWRDRLCWAGNDQDPLAILMSRQGAPLDYDYSETDSQAAVALPVDTTGLPPDATTALMPQSNDILVIGMRNAMARLVGDPRVDGSSLKVIVYGVGIVGPAAWTHGPSGELIWLSQAGLWVLPAGADATPSTLATNDPASGGLTVGSDGTLVSRTDYAQGKLPRALEHLDPSQYTVILAMDQTEMGVHIFVLPLTEGEHQHFWFDLTNLGFWPVTLDYDHEPAVALVHYLNGPDESSVLLGCRDGYIRHFRRVFQKDEAIAIASSVCYGPFQLGGGRSDVLVDALQATLAADSGIINWDLYAGTDAESVLARSSPQRSGTFQAGRNHIKRPRLTGASHLLKLSGAETRPWVIESLLAEALEVGPTRLP